MLNRSLLLTQPCRNRRRDRPDIAPQENAELEPGRIERHIARGNAGKIYQARASSTQERNAAERAASQGVALSSVSVSLSDAQGKSSGELDLVAQRTVELLDRDGSGNIEFSEFLYLHFPRSTKQDRTILAAWVEQELDSRRKKPKPLRDRLSAEQVEDIAGIFNVYNLAGDGQLSRAELAMGLQEAGLSLEQARAVAFLRAPFSRMDLRSHTVQKQQGG